MCKQADCFIGCAYGSPGVQPTYRFLPETVDATHTLKRCRVSMHPRCACANFPAPPPMLIAPPPPAMFTNQWDMALPEVTDSSKGSLGALVQRLVNGKTLDLSLRSGPMKLYDVRRLKIKPSIPALGTDSHTLPPHPCVFSARARTTAATRARSTARTAMSVASERSP